MINPTGTGNQIKVVASPSGILSDQVVEADDTIGVAFDSAESGEEVILLTRGEYGSTSVLQRESWGTGQRVYWHETLRRFTNRATHWPAGRAAEQKAGGDSGTAFGIIQLDVPMRRYGEVLAPFRFEDIQSVGDPAVNFGAPGDLLLRDFGGSVQIVQGEVVSNGLVADTVTVSLGDGTGANNQIFDSTAASALAGFDEIPNLPVTVDKAVLRIGGVGAFTAGLLVVRLSYVPAA